MLLAAVSASTERSARDTRLLALDGSDPEPAEFLLITSGSSPLRVVAISKEIELRLQRDFGRRPEAVEGRRLGEWVLMDYADFVIHIFVSDMRATYGIESLRKSAAPLDIERFRRAVSAELDAARRADLLKKANDAQNGRGGLGRGGNGEVNLLAACAVVLLIAATTRWPYFFYVLLRFLICAASAYVAHRRYTEERFLWTCVFAAIAVLFNPLFPVRMSRSDWQVINVVVAIFFGVWAIWSVNRSSGKAMAKQ